MYKATVHGFLEPDAQLSEGKIDTLSTGIEGGKKHHHGGQMTCVDLEVYM